VVILLRVQLCLCFAAGCGQPQNTATSHQVPYSKKNKFLKSGFVRSPAYNKLKTSMKAGGKASYAQCFKTKLWGGRGAGTVAVRQSPSRVIYILDGELVISRR